MSSSKLVGWALVISFALAVVGCQNTPTTPPPPAPPQIHTALHYTKTIDASGKQIGLQSNDVYAMLVVGSDQIWIGNQAGVAVYNGFSRARRDSAFDQNNGLPNPKVRCMIDLNGRLYVGTWGGGVGVYDLASGTWEAALNVEGNKLVNDQVFDIAADGDSLVIGTEGGATYYDTGTGVATNYQPLTPLVSSVLVANTPRGKETWFTPKISYRFEKPEQGFNSNGITLLRGSSTIYLKTVNSALPTLDINDILYDPSEDFYWLAFGSLGVASIDPTISKWTLYDLKNGLPSTSCYSLAKVDGKIWVATQNGLARYEPVNDRFQGYARSGGLPADRVRVVYGDAANHLFLGFVDDGAARVDPGSAQ